MVRWAVSWKRVGVAALATFVSLFAIAVSIGLASEASPQGSIGWVVVFAVVSNAVWWAVLLYPRRTK